MTRRRRVVALAVVAVVAVVALAVALTAGDEANDVAAVASTSTSSTSVVDDTSSSTATSSGTATTVTRGAATAPRVPSATTTTTTRRACASPPPGSDFAAFGATEIVIDDAAGSHRSCVLTADTPDQQQRGLMHQDDLDGYDGMIFRFPDEQERAFWMRNTRIPLSIAFYSAAGTYVSASDMEPCGDSPDCPNYHSRGPAKFALEVIKGRLPAVGATPGSVLSS